MITKIITSKSNPLIKEMVMVKENKDPTSPYFLAEGVHLLELALASNQVEKIFSINDINLKISDDIECFKVSEDVLKKLSNEKNPNDIVFLAKKKLPSTVSDNIAIYLDAVQDPGNVGTILRTAVAFSYKDVILSKGSASLYNAKTIQSAQGAIFALNVVNDDDNHSILKSLKENGYKIIITSLEKYAVFMEDFILDKAEKYVLVLGNEGRGISKEVKELGDFSIKIKISNIDSLNVAIAGGILLNYLRK